jgi:hypothetical protein
MTARTHITKFWALASAGKSAALDINTKTGELTVRCTRGAAGDEGNGEAPGTMSDDWARIMTASRGTVTQGAER